MKTILKIYALIFSTFISCNKVKDNQKKSNDKHVISETDTLIKEKKGSNYTDAYDSLQKQKIDTTTLIGKRKKIYNNHMLEDGLIEPEFDTLMDLNYDEKDDYVIGYYGKSGTGLKNMINVYVYVKKRNAYLIDEQLSRIPNPSFYINEKKITGFYIGNGGGSGQKLEWIKNKWVITKEFEVDFDHNKREKTEWKIKYPLLNKEIKIICPFQMIPPKDVLETKIKL